MNRWRESKEFNDKQCFNLANLSLSPENGDSVDGNDFLILLIPLPPSTLLTLTFYKAQSFNFDQQQQQQHNFEKIKAKV